MAGILVVSCVAAVVVGVPVLLLVKDHKATQRGKDEMALWTALWQMETAYNNYTRDHKEKLPDIVSLWRITPDLPRSVAEADTRALTPLVGKPVPFHRYYFMVSKCATLAICAYPGDDHPDWPTFIRTSCKLWSKRIGGRPVEVFSTQEDLKNDVWSIVD